MRNDIAKILGPVISMAQDVTASFDKAGKGLKFAHHSKEMIQADRRALLEARDAYLVAKVELKALRADLALAAKVAKAFATIARDISKRHLGNQWSVAWENTAHKKSLVILIKPEFLEHSMHSWHSYFKDNPSRENQEMEVTAKQAQALFQRIHDARGKVTEQKAKLAGLLAVRNEKFEILRKRLRSFINELALLIEPTDVRWKAFGFNIPGLKATPDVPQELKVKTTSATTAEVSWKRPARAKSYHVWQRPAGSDMPFVRIQTVKDSDCRLEDLRGGVAVEIAVSAVNSGGESTLSGVIAIAGASQPVPDKGNIQKT